MQRPTRKDIVFSKIDEVQQICEPLKLLGMNGFVYKRLYADGRYIDLATDPEWGDFYYKKLYEGHYQPTEIQDLHFHSEDISLWSLNQQNSIWKDAGDYFKHARGITLYEHHDQFSEAFCFYSDANNTRIDEFFINNLDLLKRFCTYFTQRAEKIISEADKKRFVAPSIYLKTAAPKAPPLSCDRLDDFLKQTELDKIPVNVEKHYSKREMEVLHWMAMGKGGDQIASILDITPRTVKAHVRNMKDKLLISNQFQLGMLYKQLQILK